MHVAVTGVTGFLGSYLVKSLHQQGHTVTGLVRASSRRDHVQPYVQRFVTGDQADESCWPAFLEGADCVIHNSVDWEALRNSNWDRHLQSNLIGSLRLLQASAPRQFVYISSVAVHHDISSRWKGVIDEDHPLRPSGAYGALKAAVEAHLWAAHFGEGRHTCALRPCAVYGIDPVLSRSHGYTVVQKLLKHERITKPGGGKFVHIDDVASAIVATVCNPKAAGKAYNLVDCYARWADWALIAADLLKVDADIDLSSPVQSKNMFSKDAAHELGVQLDRGHDGIREHLRQLIAIMSQDAATRVS